MEGSTKIRIFLEPPPHTFGRFFQNDLELFEIKNVCYAALVLFDMRLRGGVHKIRAQPFLLTPPPYPGNVFYGRPYDSRLTLKTCFSEVLGP
jgi:hypothetical protein